MLFSDKIPLPYADLVDYDKISIRLSMEDALSQRRVKSSCSLLDEEKKPKSTSEALVIFSPSKGCRHIFTMNLKISHNNESDTCLKSLSSFRADDGILYPLHFSDLPFKVQRFFLVRDVPIGERRGNHAHYVNKTYLVCAQGEIDVFLHNGN